jgi:hypothetical protein
LKVKVHGRLAGKFNVTGECVAGCAFVVLCIHRSRSHLLFFVSSRRSRLLLRVVVWSVLCVDRRPQAFVIADCRPSREDGSRSASSRKTDGTAIRDGVNSVFNERSMCCSIKLDWLLVICGRFASSNNLLSSFGTIRWRSRQFCVHGTVGSPVYFSLSNPDDFDQAQR